MNVRQFLRMTGVAAAALLVPLSTSAASAAPLPSDYQYPGQAYNCTGGDVPAGTYNSMIISGICYMPAGNVSVRGDVNVTPGALLDAVTPGDPTSGTPVVPATVLIGGNVFVGKGGVLLFGCSPDSACANPPGISFDHIRGNLIAIGAQGVVVHSASIGGSVYVSGGGGGPTAEGCTNAVPMAPGLVPWSEDPSLNMTPVYSDLEETSIGGNLNVTGLTSCWLGSLRDQVGRSANFAGNTLGDPDGSEIANNLVNGSMACSSNSPAVQFGDSGAAPNVVGGFASGECGFNVVLPNPPPEAGQGAGTPEHISVSTRSLNTYRGTHTGTNVTSLPSVTTSSGDTITADLNNFALAGRGLTGTGTLNPARLRVLRGKRSWPPSTRTGPSPLPPTTPATHAASTVRTAPFPYAPLGQLPVTASLQVPSSSPRAGRSYPAQPARGRARVAWRRSPATGASSVRARR